MPCDIDIAADYPDIPSESELNRWYDAALDNPIAGCSVRIVDTSEMQELNRTYRGKDKPTNVLSFPGDVPEGTGLVWLGDIVLCAPLIAEEATQQGKSLEAHWAHLMVHGVLHLQGLDHESPEEAHHMESREVELLASLGYPNPYGETDG